MKSDFSFKVAIVGCGNVGATAAYATLLKGIATELALIDVQPGKANGLALDMEHSLSFTPSVRLTASSKMEAAKGSRLIVVTAGKRQQEGETRLNLAQSNRAIFREMIPNIVKHAPDAILLIVTNPVDVLTFEALKFSKLPSSRVFGSGTMLDSARFQFHISEKINIHPRSVSAWILGEHGDSSFPVWSSANVVGKPLAEFSGFSEKIAKECYEKTKAAAYHIIHDLGYTCYSIGTAIAEIAESIKENSRKVFPLSVLLEDYYGVSGVCLSVPCVLGKNGIEDTLTIPLNKEEQQALTQSARTIRNFLKQ